MHSLLLTIALLLGSAVVIYLAGFVNGVEWVGEKLEVGQKGLPGPARAAVGLLRPAPPGPPTDRGTKSDMWSWGRDSWSKFRKVCVFGRL